MHDRISGRQKEERNMSAYRVRRVNIGTSEYLDELAHACGQLYSQTLVSFWRTVRHQGVWLKPKHLMRWHTSSKLHAHTADACVQAFFAALKSWRERAYKYSVEEQDRRQHPEAAAANIPRISNYSLWFSPLTVP